MPSYVLPGALAPSTAAGDIPEYLHDLIQATETHQTRLGPAQGRGGAAARTDVGELDDDDIVEIRLEGGLKLWQSVADTRVDFAAADRSVADQALLVPRTLRIGDGAGTRDGAGFAVEGVKVIRSKVVGTAGELTALAVAQHIEGKLDLGLHRCTRDSSGGEPRIAFSDPAWDKVDLSKPMLVLIHGTFSSTEGSFSDLVGTPEGQSDLWPALEAAFPAGIYALEHRSVSVDPVRNALDLAMALPNKAKVSLLSHSRGGLVAELVARDGPIDPNTGKRLNTDVYDQTDREILKKAGEDIELLDQLDKVIREKALTVERLIRIGGPIGGTTLASKRLDRALSVALNALELVPPLRVSVAYKLLKSFLLGFVKAKEDRLPGLEAMMPQSALIKLINRPDVLSAGTLHVVAGDNEGKGIFRQLRNLALDLFFGSENDFVVNTPSMTRGPQRTTAALVTPIVSAEITHFGYFRNDAGRNAILWAVEAAPAKTAGAGIVLDAEPRGVDVSRARDVGSLPVCFYLPGIMGTHLIHDKKWIWANPIRMATGGLKRLEIPGEGVSPGKIMDRYYGDLARFLSRSHDMILFPYDWREDILRTADRLAQEVRSALDESAQPVRFLAHSMGGLVVRAFMKAHPELWAMVRARPGSRVVMLGTPNAGAFSMAHTLMGRAKSIRQLSALDLVNSQKDLLKIVTSMPGAAQLLPSDSDGHYLQRSTWQELHRLHGDDWVVPPDEVFEQARASHGFFADQKFDPDVVSYVAGRGRDLTLCGIRVDQTASGRGRVKFLGTWEGDGTVTWATGIPREIQPYYMDAVHGDLACTSSAFPAIFDLLTTGRTAALSRTKPIHARGLAEPTPVVPDERIEVYPNGEDVVASFIGADAPKRTIGPAEDQRIRVTMRHGDLRFTKHPVLVGHYLGDPISGSEAALDACLDNAMTAVRDLNLYPGAIETCEVILREGRNPTGAVVAGLGRFGDLTPGKLSRTVNRAVLRYVLTLRRRAAERGIAFEEMDEISLSTLVIGHRGANMTVQQSVQAILEAVEQANRTLEKTPVTHLEFIELYDDTAHKTAGAIDAACLNGPIVEKCRFDSRISTREGAMLRIDYGFESSDWQRITVTHSGGAFGRLEFTIISDGAKAYFEQTDVDMTVIDRLLEQSRTGTATDRDLGRLLFQLMVPLELKAFAQDDQKILLIVDDSTAKYPWELMEDAVSVLGEGLYHGTGEDDFRPLVVRTPVLRQLVSPGMVVPRVGGRKALVVGDPEDTGLSALGGAREEATRVAQLLVEDGGFDVTPFIGTSNAIEILTHIMRSDYKIMHFATHGVYDKEGIDKEGVAHRPGLVLSGGISLTSASLRAMEATPEFVFLNCCHIGRIASTVKNTGPIAADLSRTLIDKGVRAVIAAGWAVDDAAAKLFAEEFYDSMFNGSRFGDAVHHARRVVFDRYPETNTWGAYQCYGDPNYRFDERDEEATGRGRRGRTFYSADHARKAAINIAGDVGSPHHSREELIAELDMLMEAADPAWRGDARWLEAMGRAYAKLDVFEPAIALLEEARANHRSLMTVHALELLERLKVGHATAAWASAERAASVSVGAAVQPAKERAAMLKEEQKDAVRAALEALEGLDALTGGKNERREVLKGAICKRKVLSYPPGAPQKRALDEMIGYYKSAMDLAALKSPGRLKPHPTFNWLSGHLAKGSQDADGQPYEAVFSQLLAQNALGENAAPSFWTASLPAEIDILRGMLATPGAQQALFARLDETFRYAWTRGGASGQARSIRDHVRFLKQTCGNSEQEAWLERVEAFLNDVTWTYRDGSGAEF